MSDKFYTPEMAGKIKDDLKAISPNWRDFLCVGLARTKEAARAKARWMAKRTMDAPCTDEELQAVIDFIDRRNDYWPQ